MHFTVKTMHNFAFWDSTDGGEAAEDAVVRVGAVHVLSPRRGFPAERVGVGGDGVHVVEGAVDVVEVPGNNTI